MQCDYTHSQSAIRVYRALQTGDYTLAELADKAFVGRRSLDNMTAVFFACGLAHICGWKRPVESNFQLCAIYRAGPGVNKPRPKRGINTASQVWVETSNAARVIVEHLSNGNKTHIECADELGYAQEYARKLLRTLTEHNRVHVVEWRKNTAGQRSPVYAPGEGLNVPRPPKQKQSDISRAHRQRLVAEYGLEIARRIGRTRSKGGPDQIIIDGKTVYRRREDRTGRKSA